MRVNQKVTLLALSVGVVLLGGCASVGNQQIADLHASQVSEKVIKGKTTEAEVRKMFGDPMKVSFTDSGNEIWKYDFTKMHAKVQNFIPVVNWFTTGETGRKKTLVFFFNQKKIVENYSMSSSHVDTHAGILP